MKKVHTIILVICSILVSSCATTGLNLGQKGTADVSLYHFKEVEQLDRSDTKKLMGNYLGPGYTRTIDDANMVMDDNTVYFVSEENVNNRLEHNLETGNFTFSKMGRYMGDFKPELPSPEKSEERSVEYLRKNEIYPENDEQLKLVHQGGLRSATIDANNQRQNVIDKAITLYYGRMVDGLNVVGPGSKIVVHVGDEGEIIGLVKRWREIAEKDSLSSSQVISEKEARRQAKEQIVQEYGKVEYEIFNTFKSYYDNNGPTLQPVYSFEVKINPGQELKPIEYLCVIPMMKNPPEKLNLRQLDPRAREMLRKMSEDENTGETQGRVD